MTAPGNPAVPVEVAERGPAAPVEAPPSEIPIVPPLPPLVLGVRVVVGVLLAAAALYAPFFFEPRFNLLLSQALYFAVAAMGLNLLTGFNGQVSIGHGAFFGVGAFTSAILIVDHGWSFEATVPVAAAITGFSGVLVGFPALRVRGLYLALLTLGFAVLLPRFASRFVSGTANQPLLQPRRAEFSSLLTFLDDDQWVYFVCLVVVLLGAVLARNLVRSRFGRAMVAVRDQEIAATTLGVNLPATKVATFGLSAAYAGVAGSLSVMVDRLADGTNAILYFQRSIEFLVAMVIGGAATILGPVVGAFVLIALRRNSEDLIEGKELLAPAIFGGALIVAVFVLPQGIVGGFHRLLARWSRGRVRRSPPNGGDASLSTEAGPEPEPG
jgi:branched-chain amino acid transport system permease protein